MIKYTEDLYANIVAFPRKINHRDFMWYTIFDVVLFAECSRESYMAKIRNLRFDLLLSA